MSSPSLTPVLDLEAFDASSLTLDFKIEIYTPEGLPTGTYYDLTGKVVTLFINQNFAEPFVMLSSASPNIYGSDILITNAALGEFRLFLGEDELKRAQRTDGFYRLEVNDVGADPLILMRGSFKVISLVTGGNI